MGNELIYRRQARGVPAQIRKIILQENWIQAAINVNEQNTPMEYLFDTYMEFIDQSGQYDDFTCGSCRQHVLDEWKKLEPFLVEQEKENTVENPAVHATHRMNRIILFAATKKYDA